MIYTLMHEDRKLVLFEVDKLYNFKQLVVTNDRNFIPYLPVGKNNNIDIKKWILTRGIPSTRDNIKSELRELKLVSPFQLLLQNRGLSLTDHYWFLKADEEYKWSTINLYTNNFKAFYSLDLYDDIKNIRDKTNFIPSTSLKGDLKKKWIIDQYGTRRMVKGNYNNTARQSISEVIATELHKRQGKYSFSPYSLINITSDGNNILGCENPCFTSIDTEFIPASDIIELDNKPNNMSWFDFYVLICNQHGLNIRPFLEYQILSDFVMSNQDRHFNNFGIIRNSHTLEWLGYAPIFDSGSSLFYRTKSIPKGRKLLDLRTHTFLTWEKKLLKYVINRGILDICLLPDANYIYNMLKLDYFSNSDECEEVTKAYLTKIKFLSDFQNGIDIWRNSYWRSMENKL